jgi:murein DD-endopeptidase MepM/ murein hydrolase activator NlpD
MPVPEPASGGRLLTVRKRKLQGALALVLMLGLAVPTDPVGAQGAAEEVEDAQARYNAARREAFAATARYEEAHSALNATREEIAATQRALDDASRRIEGLQEQLNERARAAYQLGSTSTFDVLLEAHDLSEFSDRLVYLDRIAQDDADLATRVAVISEELRRLKTNLGRLEDEQQVITERAQREQQTFQEKLAEAQTILEEAEFKLEQEQAAALLQAGTGGSSPGQIATVAGAALQACPAPGSSFGDTFGAPRSGGRSHAGVDMMGSYGSPIYAALPGTVSFSSSSLGGNQAYVHSAGGTYTFYAHLQGYVGSSRAVAAGELIGEMGDTGNATGTPHLHFEYHPNGTLVNPTPFVAAVC